MTNNYPTYEEALETAAEAAQEAYASNEEVSSAKAIEEAMKAHSRVVADWDRNRPIFKD